MDDLRQLNRLGRENSDLKRKLQRQLERQGKQQRMNKKQKNQMAKQEDFIQFIKKEEKDYSPSHSSSSVGDEFGGTSISSD